MPIVSPSGQNVAQQIGPVGAPATAQYSYRKMVGFLLEFNPDLPVQVAQGFLQIAYRRILDHANFYGTLVKGLVTVPDNISTGTASVTTASTTITGVGTAFDPVMVGRQFRVGFSNPIYTIATVTSATQLDLDFPWGGKTQAGVGYQIFQNIVSFGNNIKRLLAVVNQRQGYRMQLHVPQEVLNARDVWRTTTGWTHTVASYAPSPDGQPQFELYPAPTFQQSFPFLAYVQPPDFLNDNDTPVLSIRSDVILYGALPHVLRFRGKNSKYYDPETANYYENLFHMELEKMDKNADALYPRWLLYEFAKVPAYGQGASFWQSHEDYPG